MSKKVFISHITEESKYANALKFILKYYYNDQVEVFVSSDKESLKYARRFEYQIYDALKDSDCLILICSNRSKFRPWVNFEAGFFVSKFYCMSEGSLDRIPILPVCVDGLNFEDLPYVLKQYQGLKICEIEDIKRLFNDLFPDLHIERDRIVEDDIEFHLNVFLEDRNKKSINEYMIIRNMLSIPIKRIIYHSKSFFDLYESNSIIYIKKELRFVRKTVKFVKDKDKLKSIFDGIEASSKIINENSKFAISICNDNELKIILVKMAAGEVSFSLSSDLFSIILNSDASLPFNLRDKKINEIIERNKKVIWNSIDIIYKTLKYFFEILEEYLLYIDKKYRN